jgi:hypothetical protein
LATPIPGWSRNITGIWHRATSLTPSALALHGLGIHRVRLSRCTPASRRHCEVSGAWLNAASLLDETDACFIVRDVNGQAQG